jgi:hypothetical protein
LDFGDPGVTALSQACEEQKFSQYPNEIKGAVA